MAGLTVAEVAGIVALGTAIIGFLGPNLIALVIAACVGRSRSAGTWSVVGRELQSSHWPLFLQTDTSTSSDIPRTIGLLCWLQKVAWLLITVAGIATPFGLRSEVRLDANPRLATFQRVSDTGPMGKGTPPRDPDAFFNRICYSSLNVPATCPFSDTKIVMTDKDGTNITYSQDGTYDVRMPYDTAEIFSSLHDEHQQSVSGPFDMQWRHYTYKSMTVDSTESINNGNRFQVGVYRPLDTLLLDDTIEPIDGLVVNSKDGGIAFRNHTGPVDIDIGGEWEEDLLFVSPETVCVDTNLTYDFQIVNSGKLDFSLSAGVIKNLSLTDRGGFSLINQTVPFGVGPNTEGQHDLDLRLRAYSGAWINNILSMFYFNVTHPATGKYEHHKSYMTSHVGKKFYLDAATFTAAPNLLQISGHYGPYISNDDHEALNGTFIRHNSSLDDPRTVYYNPFRITWENFTDANTICSGAGSSDNANITNVGVMCGLMFGAATRIDGHSSLILSPGSWWTQPIYSCATALKADIKQVTFSWNDSVEERNPLRKLTVRKIEDNSYKSKADEPYWAVENLHRNLYKDYPLWGLVSSKFAGLYQDNRYIDILRSPRLFLPGFTGDSYSFPSGDYPADSNLAASNALIGGLIQAYQTSVDIDTPFYTGATSMSLYQKWQELSGSADTAAKIPNLIWTDIMANALIGTRSRLSDNSLPNNIQPKQASARDSASKRDTSPGSATSNAEVPIRLYRNQVTYRWLFAIPALLTLALLALILAISLCLTAVGQMAGPRTLRSLLHWTSAGRLLAMLKDQQAIGSIEETTAYHNDISEEQSAATSLKSGPLLTAREVREVRPMDVRSKQWMKTEGLRTIDLDAIGRIYAL